MSDPEHYRHCSSCKAPIAFGARYYRCSVSTCNRVRANYAFCSAQCQQAHSVTVNHRDAWAEEETAPSKQRWLAEQAALVLPTAPNAEPARRVVGGPAPKEAPESSDEVLIVVSKLKKYVRDKSGMNTSDAVFAVLSNHLRYVATQAIRIAATNERKTVLERDAIQAVEALVRPRP